MTNNERYSNALHAVQTGVAVELQREVTAVTAGNPNHLSNSDLLRMVKHLRTGNNARAVDHCALVRLLIKKGLFTLEEYGQECADEMANEADRYRERLNLAPNVTLV